MFGLDGNNLQIHHYLALGGGALAIIAVLMRLVLPAGFKAPAAALGIIAALFVGIFVGVIASTTLGTGAARADDSKADGDPKPIAPPTPKGMPGGFGMPGMGGGKGGGKGGAKGGKGQAFGPSAKAQLAVLVNKLDQLAAKPLTLTLDLTSDQRAAIQEQIQSLADLDELNDEDAKKKLDAILEAVKDNRGTLEAAGYRWPGAGGPPMQPVANPFREGEGRERLTSLLERLKKN